MNHLNEQEIATLERLLDERERMLRSGVHEHVSSLLENPNTGMTTPAGDVADRAEVGLLRDRESAAVVREVRELRDIEAARARITAGEAGICIDCDDEIPFARLHAQPAASRCVSCQSLYERLHLATPVQEAMSGEE